jgi:glycosyl transferase family 87
MEPIAKESSAPGPTSLFRKVLLGLALIAALAFLAMHFTRQENKSVLPILDFVEYWASGRLCLTNGNPYSWDAMLELEKSVGMKPDHSPITGEETPLMMFNPPWTLVFVMPLAWPSFALSRLIVFVLGVGMVVFCADAIWRIYGGAIEKRWIAWLVALTFVPTLQVLQMGQIGPLILLGLVAFLFYVHESGWAAGIATVLIAIKPHLFGVFAAALFLWTIHHRRWSIFAGAAVTVTIIMGCLLAANPHLIEQYAHCIRVHSPRDGRTPVFGSLFRIIFDRNQFWLQVIPQVIGLIWIVVYWYRRRDHWDWHEELPLLVLVSMLTTPYGAWPFDLVVLLLPVIEMAARSRLAARPQLAIIIAVYLVIQVPAMALSVAGVDLFYFVWMPPALLLSYLGLRRMLARRTTEARYLAAELAPRGASPVAK